MKVKSNVCTLFTLLTLSHLPHALAQNNLVPGEKSLLYYKIGGGEPISRPANPGTATAKIGLGGAARLNYSCGRFDADLTIKNLMNGFSQVGTAVENNVKAGIASLPMYIFQRATPGLYELFQTYMKKAETQFSVAMKTCEDMEAAIRDGKNPYEDWIKQAKEENWKTTSYSTQDAVQAKSLIEDEGGVKGVTWIGGNKKGGRNQPPIEVIRDISQAGYNITMNRPPATTPTAPNTTDTKLARSFPTAKAAADWAVSVIGDRQIATCDEVACPSKASVPGTGLLQKFEQERTLVETQLSNVLSATGVPDGESLDKASAPGVAVSRELIDALRSLRPTERQIASNRLAMEIAQARTLDRALLVRNLLQTGAGVPEAGFDSAQKEVKARVTELNRYIDDLLFETRVRREVVSSTASQLIESYRNERLQSTNTQTQSRTDKRPLENGRVQ